MARDKCKIGDVFSVKLDGEKKYFQYVANDLTQLNSDVIRAFKREYPIDAKPEPKEIVLGQIDFYAHCVIKWGVRMGLWVNIGNVQDIGNNDALFRDTNDYGRKAGDSPVRVSDRWYVWRINEEFRRVGKLDDETRKAFVGIVINPLGIIELLKGKKYPPNYPT